MTRKDQRRFSSIWWRAGGFCFNPYTDRVELAKNETDHYLRPARLWRNDCRKLPNRRERRWWERMANDSESGAMV